jgi:hypothetical protein
MQDTIEQFKGYGKERQREIIVKTINKLLVAYYGEPTSYQLLMLKSDGEFDTVHSLTDEKGIFKRLREALRQSIEHARIAEKQSNAKNN